MEQVFLCPWCSLKTAVSISSQPCFLKDFSCTSSSQPGSNIKPLPPCCQARWGVALGHRSRRQKGPQPALPFVLQLRAAPWAGATAGVIGGASSPPEQWLCTPESNIWPRLEDGGMETLYKRTDFGRTGQVIYTTKVPVNKTRPLEEHRTLFFSIFGLFF